MSLRTILTVTVAVLGALALAAAGSLALIGALFDRSASELAGALESVRLAEAVQVDLLTLAHRRVSPADGLETIASEPDLEDGLRRQIAEMRRYSAGPAESALIADVAAKVDAYLAEADPTKTPVAAPAGSLRLQAAFEVTQRLVRLNVEQARTAQTRAATWRRARSGGVAAASGLLLALTAMLLWVRRSALRPIFAIAHAMRRFGAGDRAARAPESGPAEVAAVARTFNEMASALERERESQLTFLAGVAHDLRNPLSTLKLNAELVPPEGPLPGEAELRSMFRRLARQVDRLQRMVSDLLDAARAEAGQLTVSLESCDVRELVSEVVEQYRPGAPGHRIDVSLPEVPVRVRCDPGRIEQVLGNLVGNAIKYMPDGGRVEVNLSAGEGRATLSVADEGLGIPPEDQPHIFEPFRRAAWHDRIPGAGLGLAVARRIVEAHGGRIEVESAPGAGSVFRVHLPAA